MPSPFNITAISHDTAAFPWQHRAPFAGLSTVATLALILLVGHATGHDAAGAIAAASALTVGFATFHATLASTVLSMTLLTLGMASGTLAGSLGAEHTSIVLILAVIAAINFGLLSGISDTAAWIGQQCAVFVILNSYFQYGVQYAAGRAGMVLTGGTLAIVLHALTVRFQRATATDAAPAPSLGPLHIRLEIRARELWEDLRGLRHTSGSTASYTLRLVLTLFITTAIYRHYHMRNGYWMPMTSVLRPDWTGTLSRGIARLVGTIAGVSIALGLARVLPSLPENLWIVFALLLLAAWGCYTLINVNYAAFSLCITLFIVFLFRFGGFSETTAAHLRLANTALGGGIALIMDSLWALFTRNHSGPPTDPDATTTPSHQSPDFKNRTSRGAAAG